MTDSTANIYGRAATMPGDVAMSRLADRLAAMAPPPLDLSPHTIVRQSPAVQAALTTSAAIAKRADERARRSRRSIVAMTVDSFVSACSFVPYALVALGLRLIMARVFFLDGQTRIDGPRLPLDIQGFDLSVVLPMQVKAETFAAFLTQYPPLPVPPTLAAYALSYAEFILPAMLVLGFGARFAALCLLIITALIQVYVLPDALWTVHVYWAAILTVLLSRGPGQVSVDHIIRLFTQRER